MTSLVVAGALVLSAFVVERAGLTGTLGAWWGVPLGIVIAALPPPGGAWTPGRAARRVGLLTPLAVAGGWLAGWGPLTPLRVWLVTAVTVFALFAAYRRAVGAEAWTLEYPTRTLTYALLAQPAAFLLVVTASAPGLTGPGLGSFLVTGRWWAHLSLILTYGGLVVFGLRTPKGAHTALAHPRALPVVIPVGLALVALPALLWELPLAWIVCGPLLWIGLTCPPRIAGAALLGVLAVSVTVDVVTSPAEPSPARLSAEIGLTLLLMVSSVLASTVVALRERTARLTARIRAEGQRQAAQHLLLDTAIAAVTDGVLVTDTGGTVLRANPAAYTILGHVRPGTASGWAAAYGLRAHDGGELSEDAVARLYAPGVGAPGRLTLRAPAGTGERDLDDRVYEARVQALVSGPDPLTLVVLSDVTSRQARRQELQSFAGTVAHDLKNPLAAAGLWIELAREEWAEDPAEGRAALGRARGACRRMREMIDDYLTYTVTRAGVLRPEPVHLASTAHEVIAPYAGRPDGPTFAVDADLWVHADTALVRQLLANLVANAVKYARPGEAARVQIRAEGDAEPGWARVAVADEGLGIAPQDRDAVFRPFARTTQGATTARGIGLGLALCRAIVLRHQGRIRAVGRPGGGTVIEFTLPLAQQTG